MPPMPAKSCVSPRASGQPFFPRSLPPAITVITDEKEGTITFTDTGIGMTHGELVENLGHHRPFRHQGVPQATGGGQTPDAKLIGQFGVGFYSAFMVANKVTVCSRSALAG